MANRFNLLVFDWDGTLSDSKSGIPTAMQLAIQELELTERHDVEICEITGLGLEEAIDTLYPGIELGQRHELARLYRHYYPLVTAGSTPLFPGTQAIIASLYNAGYLLAVATGKSRRVIDRSLRENNLDNYFHASRCADETFSKPHPQMLMDIMHMLDVSPERTLMTGDSEYDLQMAMNAEVASLAVSYGVHPSGRLLEFRPLACLDRLAELPVWLGQPETG